jgi:hypothetical protein
MNTTVIYKSGTHPKQGWDVMQVIYQREELGVRQTVNSFVIARDVAGNIVRKTDIVLDRWEIISDPDDLRDFQKCFDDRDRLAIEKTNNAAS